MGRKGGSGMSGGGGGGYRSAAPSASASGESVQGGITTNFTVNDFNHVSEDRWESKMQTVDSAAISRTGRTVPVALRTTGSKFLVLKNGNRYTSYLVGLNRRTRIKSSSSLDAAINSINQYTKKYVVR